MNCRECKFWEEDRNGTGFGNCHRYPQVQHIGQNGWCGEFVCRVPLTVIEPVAPETARKVGRPKKEVSGAKNN